MRNSAEQIGARYGFNLTDELNAAASGSFPVNEGAPVKEDWFETYYEGRLAAFETFAARLTREIEAYSPQLQITASFEDDGETGGVVLRMGEREYRAEDKRPDKREPVASTHQRNGAFMLSARSAVDALIVDLTEKHPQLAEAAAQQRAGLSTRCSVRCHEYLRRAGRYEMWQIARGRQDPRSALN